MYLEKVPESILTTTLVKIKYDCCGKDHVLKWKDADKNFKKNGKHICRICGLKLNNPARRAEVQAKIKKTNIERYGCASALNTKENTAARNEKMFGTEEAVAARNEKIKKTNLERYGAEHIMKTDEGVRRLNDAMQERYGVDFPLQSKQAQEKLKKTCQERYGADNPLSSPEVRAKGAQTTLEKYGVEHYNQLPEMKEYLRQNCTIWLADSYANPWAAGITRPEEWCQKQSETMTRLFIEGKIKETGGKGTAKGHFIGKKCRKNRPLYRSSLELLFHFHLETSEDVEWYDYEPFSIKYINEDGKERRYIPDFLVKYRSRPEVVIVEVKPQFRMREATTELKVAAGNVYAELNGMAFEYWDQNMIYAFGNKLSDVIDSSYVESI